MVTGGSLGAQILDDVVPVAIAAMKNKKIFVTHQTRPENVARLQKFYAENKIHANVLSFIHDMAATIADADLVIGRSGASTVVELETIGRGAIFVPTPSIWRLTGRQRSITTAILRFFPFFRRFLRIFGDILPISRPRIWA